MAGDIPLYFVDLQDDLDDFGFEDYEPDCETMRITAFLDIPGQDNLTPLARLEKYAFSDNIFNRQIIARGLLDVLRDFSNNEEDFLTVMEIVVRLAEDTEPTVRTELMEQVPPIAIFLQESRPNFPSAFSEYLLPIVVRYLTDPNNQVRKASQEALLILLEQDLIELNDIENKVCPVLLDLSAADSDDEYKVEAVNIICKMTSMLGRDTVEQVLLPRFCELCSDGKLFQVRKIPKFLELCTDSVWGMRKACAECFMAVSYTASGEIRRTKLSPLFINLISDPCRWVRQAAFQSLGPFISTFANPSSAGLYIREDGTLSIRPPVENVAASCSQNPTNSSSSRSGSPLETEVSLPRELMSSENNNLINRSPNPGGAYVMCSASTTESQNQLILGNATGSVVLKDLGKCAGGAGDGGCAGMSSKAQAENAEDMYNSFLYWRSPLPDISQDLEILHSKSMEDDDSKRDQRLMNVCNSFTASSEIKKVLESLQEHMDDPDVEAQVQVLSAALRAAHLDSMHEDYAKSSEEDTSNCQVVLHAKTSTDSDNKDTSSSPSVHKEQMPKSSASSLQSISSPNELDRANEHLQERSTNFVLDNRKSKFQNIIPQPLLDQYLSMTDPARAQTVDTEIAKHCAYSLPGVALTLGRQNWHCLRDTYETLASDEQWKVRRTLAFSIHELAVILGDKLTAADLVPIFNGFLKDLDEVRIGVLKHLYDFLKLLQSDKRREYLYQLQEFMVTDNSRNWRFRYELAEQLILILELYNPVDVYDYLRHIALTLCSDKVSEVRWISFKLVVAVLDKFYTNGENELGLNFINELIVRFRHSSKWVGRQAFAFICQLVIEEECMPVEQFVMHLLPSLLSLAADPVPNVRVLLAKALRRTLLERAYFVSVGNPHVEVVEETVLALQSDRDQDVRFFASAQPKNSNTNSTVLQQES
ncbi:serine/threonine-protein phosphatase 4 regulatory subunit 1 isoform X2 [Microcaecilia unicolor]|uniref:Serine/threonine-protein phosphatase 4 regulatory subunit 1-like isoform X2 n=1 Tax=Microcaecilia unicolor TaxID=1415580 RepID=A0A6P7YZ40_9AMPH|nr:serine/threonine-protein phosphatase 4 regulatory subunit 1-like isoform X2 [Microcaecilia unicolor]